MTSEQNEQWKSAIKPLDYLDHYALSDRGLAEARKRLMSWGVPIWAVEFRTRFLLHSGIKPMALWMPEFALRSEVAMIGIQILYLQPYSSEAETEEVYQRVHECVYGYSNPGYDHEHHASAFLGALEAECPPPDWLPKNI